MIADPAHVLQPAAAYLRRSTDRQEQALGDQRTEIRRWAGENGFEVVREVRGRCLVGHEQLRAAPVSSG